jgi:hypothetical protein
MQRESGDEHYEIPVHENLPPRRVIGISVFLQVAYGAGEKPRMVHTSIFMVQYATNLIGWNNNWNRHSWSFGADSELSHV